MSKKNIETGYELSSISRIVKEQGVGEINRKYIKFREGAMHPVFTKENKKTKINPK